MYYHSQTFWATYVMYFKLVRKSENLLRKTAESDFNNAHWYYNMSNFIYKDMSTIGFEMSYIYCWQYTKCFMAILVTVYGSHKVETSIGSSCLGRLWNRNLAPSGVQTTRTQMFHILLHYKKSIQNSYYKIKQYLIFI